METIKDYLLCDNCKSKNFIKIYSFSTQFRSVNFSDNLIYDEVIEESYQCTHCHKIISKKQIEKRLRDITDARVKASDITGK